MTGARDITRLCFSSNLAGIVANNIEQSFYSVYFYSGIESIKHALKVYIKKLEKSQVMYSKWFRFPRLTMVFVAGFRSGSIQKRKAGFQAALRSI